METPANPQDNLRHFGGTYNPVHTRFRATTHSAALNNYLEIIMITFHNKPELKEMLVEEIKKHRAADDILQGAYENKGKYCAVGCSIESLNTRLGKTYSHSDHSVYETELGIPQIIARLEDRIFEGLTRDESKDFPLSFIEAVPVGVDLSLAWPKFAVWLLGDEQDGVIRFAKTDKQKKAITDVVKLYERVIAGGDIEKMKQEFKDAAAAAADAAYAASAAAAAAYADAAYAAAAAAAYADAYADARPIHYKKCADKLIEIISNTN